MNTTDERKTTRVLIVDDVAEVRRDLRTLLSLSGDLEIIGEAADGREAVRLAASIQPDVILMDLEMPVLDGNEATRQVKALVPACRVVMLTVHDYPEARAAARESSADAFLVKGASVEEIIRSLVSPGKGV
ncbi:MAG: response regulator transcription factor [Chloroflexi bacterium]|nr:response regulator transcription factor [Chloroflexota bacterium]